MQIGGINLQCNMDISLYQIHCKALRIFGYESVGFNILVSMLPRDNFFHIKDLSHIQSTPSPLPPSPHVHVRASFYRKCTETFF